MVVVVVLRLPNNKSQRVYIFVVSIGGERPNVIYRKSCSGHVIVIMSHYDPSYMTC